MAQEHISALVKIKPELSRDDAIWAYVFANGVGMTIMAKTGRLGRPSI